MWLWPCTVIKISWFSFWCRAREASREGDRVSSVRQMVSIPQHTGSIYIFLGSTYRKINAMSKNGLGFVGTMPTASVACVFSQHGYVRVVFWGLLFTVSQHSLEHCADNFILLAMLFLAPSRLAWVSMSDFLLLHIGVLSLDWFALGTSVILEGALDRFLNYLFFPLPLLCMS